MAEENGPVQFMSQMVDLDYAIVTNPASRRFGEQVANHNIVGQKCPSCSRVFLPPKGFCPICCAVMDASHEVEVKDTGVLTSFTVITPIQYRGQEEKEEYVLANVLLDGADQTIGQQRISGVPNDEVRMGMRVKAIWAGPDEQAEEGGGMRGWGLGSAVKAWEPTGEPDMPKETYEEHVL